MVKRELKGRGGARLKFLNALTVFATHTLFTVVDAASFPDTENLK